MKPFDQLAPLEAAIRRAVLADSFAESQALLEQYAAEAEHVLRQGPIGREDMRDLKTRTDALFEWVTVMVQISRAQLAAGLANARCVSRYRDPAPRPPRLQARA